MVLLVVRYLTMFMVPLVGAWCWCLPTQNVSHYKKFYRTRHRDDGSCYGIERENHGVRLCRSGIDNGNDIGNDNANDNVRRADDDIGEGGANTVVGATTSRRRALMVSVAAAAAATATRTGASTIPFSWSPQQLSPRNVAGSDDDNDTDTTTNPEKPATTGIATTEDEHYGNLLKSSNLYTVQTASTTTTIGTMLSRKIPRGIPSVHKVTPERLLHDLQSKRAVFLGEHHPEIRDHRLQAALIRSLHAAIHKDDDDDSKSEPVRPTTSTTLVVGLEAVQKQFQPILDRYCAGSIDEDELQRATEWESRWYWSFEAYRPVFQTCRELGIDLLALDVATEDRLVVENGGFDALGPEKFKEYVPDQDGFAAFGRTSAYQTYVSYTLKPPYELQQRTNNNNNTTSTAISFPNFVARQMLRDEGMASTAYGWLSKNPQGILVGCIGVNHATFGCGVPGRLERMLSSPSNRARARNSKQQVASVLINPEPLNTGTALEICQTEGTPPLDDDDDDDDDEHSARRQLIFVPNTNNQICIENSVELQNYALQLDYGSSSPGGLRGRRTVVNEAAAVRQARNGETVLGLSDYLVFSPKDTTTSRYD